MFQTKDTHEPHIQQHVSGYPTLNTLVPFLFPSRRRLLLIKELTYIWRYL